MGPLCGSIASILRLSCATLRLDTVNLRLNCVTLRLNEINVRHKRATLRLSREIESQSEVIEPQIFGNGRVNGWRVRQGAEVVLPLRSNAYARFKGILLDEAKQR